MAYVERTALTAEQRKGLRWFADHIPGPEVAGPGPFADGAAFSLAVLQILGDKGFAARTAARGQMTREIYAGKSNPTRKSEIEAEVDAAFPDLE